MLYFYSNYKNDFFTNDFFTITNAMYAPYGLSLSSDI